MTATSATIERLQVLEQLYAHGYQDEVIDLTLRKLLEHQVQKDETQLATLRADLRRFEQQYGMTSADFLAKYQAGQMGDHMDVFEWNVFYKMYVRLAEAVDVMRAHLKE